MDTRPVLLTPRRLIGRLYVQSEPNAAHGPHVEGSEDVEHCRVLDLKRTHVGMTYITFTPLR